MRLCINPHCETAREHLDTATTCDRCGCQLLVGDRYTATSLLSDKSGFGIVYEVVDDSAQQTLRERDRRRVLKILKPEFNQEPRTVALFEQEARLLQQLDAPGLPKIDAYIDRELPDGQILHGIIMEKISGSNLFDWLHARGNEPIDERTAITWLRQLVTTLELVHRQNYFHRDIKPSNIMLAPSGKLILIDFGSARHESLTYLDKLYGKGGITQIASAGYTAPEQERGFAVPQSDFYALGMTFIHLVTGKYPLEMYEPHSNTYQWRAHAVQISPAFADFLDNLIAIPPIERPIDCANILQSLTELESPPLSAPKATAPAIERWVWSGALALFMGAIGYGLAVWVQLLPAPFDRDRPTSDRLQIPECASDAAAAANCQLPRSAQDNATTSR